MHNHLTALQSINSFQVTTLARILSNASNFVIVGITISVAVVKSKRRRKKSQLFKVDTNIMNVGAVIDHTLRLGKEQKMAMEIAIQDVNCFSSSRLVVKFSNSYGNSAWAVNAGKV